MAAKSRITTHCEEAAASLAAPSCRWSAIADGLALAALGNLIGLIAPKREPPQYWNASSALLYARSLLVLFSPAAGGAGTRRPRPDEVLHRLATVGLMGRNLKRSVAAGAPTGLVLGAFGLALLFLSERVLHAASQAPRMKPPAAVRFTFGQLLLLTAVSEELAFRGVLQHRLRTSFQARNAILLSSLFFGLWHGVFNARTLTALGVTGRLRFSLGSVVQMGSVYVGGLAFGLLRERWGNLAGPIVAHWLADVLLNVRFLPACRGSAAERRTNSE